EPLLRGGKGLDEVAAIEGHCRQLQVPAGHQQGAAGRFPRRGHHPGGARTLNPPRLTPRGKETPPPPARAHRPTWCAVRCCARRDGSNFRSSNPFNLVASDDEWTAPIMAEVGPDGCVWVIDWYNYIVQHNPTPPGFTTGKGNAYLTDLRDKTHGRIYRIVYDGK